LQLVLQYNPSHSLSATVLSPFCRTNKKQIS